MQVPLHQLSLANYFAWEAQRTERHEFHRGETYAMVGARRGHARVVANLVRHLGNHLDGTPCQVFSGGLKVRVGDDTVVYPDVFVSCDERYRADDMAVTSPKLVIEVLSPRSLGGRARWPNTLWSVPTPAASRCSGRTRTATGSCST